MPSSLQSSASTEGNILVIEEYDALAAAIRSALKKFAPDHRTHIAASLEEARKLTAKVTPELFLVDFDPPIAGFVSFLDELRKTQPRARVLIITAGAPHEVLRRRTQPSALDFLEKPFELSSLGEAVEALLRGNAASPACWRGTLSDLNAGDLIPLLCLEKAEGVLNLRESEGDQRGTIHFARGKMIHSTAGELAGIEALREVLDWVAPDFTITEGPSEPRRTLTGAWSAVLDVALRGMRRTRPSKTQPEPREVPAPPRQEEKEAPPPRDGKKVAVIDDTETLRVFVEEMLSSANARMQIETSANGEDGVRICLSFRPDLILLDFSLPDFNGDEVCRRLLEQEETRAIPVIMMSGHVAEMAAAAARYENIVLTLPKPFLSAALIEAVSEILTNPPVVRPRKPIVSQPIPSPEKIDSPPTAPKHKPNGKSPAIPLESKPSALLPAVTTIERDAPQPPTLAPEAITRFAGEMSALHPPVAVLPARGSAVIVKIPLEVMAMRFSPALRITAVRARPFSSTVSLHVDPRDVLSGQAPETAFEIARVNLDERGQIQTILLAPASEPSGFRQSTAIVPIREIIAMPMNGSSSVQLVPAANNPMTIAVLVAFDLVGVELSPAFRVSFLELRAHRGRVRVVQLSHGEETGLTFEAAQILLDRSARVAEILLESAVRELPTS